MSYRSFCSVAALAVAGFMGTSAFADAARPSLLSASTVVTAPQAGEDEESVWNRIQTAISDTSNGTVVLKPGTYRIKKPLTFTNGASLCGEGSDREQVVLSLVTKNADDGTQSIIQITGSAQTTISNLTVSGKEAVFGNTAYGPDSAIKMDSGLIVDCLIADVRTINKARHGGGIHMSGGTVRNCTITRCEADNSGGNQGNGEAIYMSGGLVENCVITENTVSGACNSGQPGGAVYISGGTLRGCLVSKNSNHAYATGVAAAGNCTVENCTIVDNRRFNLNSYGYGVAVLGSGVVLRNNIIWNNTTTDGTSPMNVYIKSDVSDVVLQHNDSRPAIDGGEGNIEVDPLFVDAAYHPGYTGCTDGGIDQTWMSGAVDLDGNPRIALEHVDIGCYERDTKGSTIFVNYDRSQLDSAVVSLAFDADNETVSSVQWTLTRQQDQTVVTAGGAAAEVSLPIGVWDVRAVAQCVGKSLEFESLGAVDIRARRVYVNAANASSGGVYPYARVQDGCPSIDTAFKLLTTGGTLYIAEGSYVIESVLSLEKRCGTRIESLAGPAKTIVRVGNTTALKNSYALKLDYEDSYVSGVTFVGGRPGDYYSGTEYGSRGFVSVAGSSSVLTNCVFQDLKYAQERVWGTGLDLKAGTVVDCRFSRIDAFCSGSANPQSGVIKISGGLADRLTILSCELKGKANVSRAYSSGDVVGVLNSGILRNSLIAYCTTEHETPVYVGPQAGGTSGGHLINCTIVANQSLQMAAADGNGNAYVHAGGVIVKNGEVVNCIIVDNKSSFEDAVSNIYNDNTQSDLAAGITYTLINDPGAAPAFATAANHNIVVSPSTTLFRKPEQGDFSLMGTCAAVNVGQKLAWMETARDLAGNPRVISRIPDLGCYESRPKGLALRLR